MALSIPVNQIIKQLNLPLLVSIGVHGIFFTLILPKWHSDSGFIGSNKSQNTPVIELNELEQTRIPNYNQPQTFNWDIINSLPESNNQIPTLNTPIPLPQNNYNSLPIPQIRPQIRPQINNSNTINLPSLPPLPPPPASFYNNPSQIPLPNFPTNFSTPPQLSSIPKINEQVNQEIINDLPPIIDTDLPIDKNNITPEEARIRQQIFANSPIEVTINPRDIINGRNDSGKIEINQNNSSTNNISSSSLPKKYNNLANNLAKNSANTTPKEANKNYINWTQKVKNVKSQQITLQGKYPKDACIRKLEGTTTYGVTVNPAGSVIGTQLIKSSGYGLFNNQALAQIKSRGFANNTNVNKPYHVYVNFKYNNKICPSISLSNLGKVPQNKSPNQPSQVVSPKNSSTGNNNPTPTPAIKNSAPVQIETVLPVESPSKQENQTIKKSQPSSTNTNKIETVLPAESPSKQENQTTKKPQQISTPSSSTPNLPNSPANKAEMLVIPNQSPSPTIKQKPMAPSTSSQTKPITPKPFKKKISPLPSLESNDQPETDNSEEIKLIKQHFKN